MNNVFDIAAVEISVDEMDVDYEGDQDMLDLYDSNYGSMTTFSDYQMEESNPPPPMGALALMPSPSFGGESIVPVPMNPTTSNSSAAINDPMHQTVLQVVLASNKRMSNIQKTDLMERNSSVSKI